VDNSFFYDLGSNFSKQVMYDFKGNLKNLNNRSADLEPKDIPKECDVIICSSFKINISSYIDVDEGNIYFYWMNLFDIK